MLPADAPYWTYVEGQARRWAELYGYGEIRTPTFEFAGVFQRAVGQGTDIVEKEMYTFRDKGNDELTLRPEMTAAVMRAYLEHGLFNRPQPVKVHAIANLFRYDRPQAGRYREFHQFNIEAIGEADPLLDAEVISLLWDFLSGLQLSDVTLALNSIGCPRCRPDYLNALVAYYEQHEAEICEDCRRRLRTNPMRLLDCKNATCQPLIEAAPRSVDYLCEPCAEHFQKVRRYLDEVRLPYALTHRLVRGLDYYTRTVFEAWPNAGGSQSSLGGGGRYDGLAEQLGGDPTPGIGFAAGLERIILSLKQRSIAVPGAPGIRVFIAPLGEPARARSFGLARDLRSGGVACVAALGDRSLKAHLRRANSLGARWAMILGDDELAADTVTLLDLAKGEQVRLAVNEAIGRVMESGAHAS
jgi:histidyl-tRNA synthetase